MYATAEERNNSFLLPITIIRERIKEARDNGIDRPNEYNAENDEGAFLQYKKGILKKFYDQNCWCPPPNI